MNVTFRVITEAHLAVIHGFPTNCSLKTRLAKPNLMYVIIILQEGYSNYLYILNTACIHASVTTKQKKDG